MEIILDVIDEGFWAMLLVINSQEFPKRINFLSI